ncbi:MAG: DUF2911 domain-containing protein [Bacteroidota bacterium]
MKKLFFLTLITGLMCTALGASAQKKEKPSPADTVKGTTSKGVDITIAYSQPGIKGRTLGKEIATYGQLWRTGANEQTAITVSKDVKVEGNELPAGKYSIWSIPGETEWVIIINKNTTNWGTNHDEPSDLFRFTVKTQKAKKFAERFKFAIEKSGKVSFVWGDALVAFSVK